MCLEHVENHNVKPGMALFASIYKGSGGCDRRVSFVQWLLSWLLLYLSYLNCALLVRYLCDTCALLVRYLCITWETTHIPRRSSNCNLLSFSNLCSKKSFFSSQLRLMRSKRKGKVNAIREKYNGVAWRLPPGCTKLRYSIAIVIDDGEAIAYSGFFRIGFEFG